MRPDRAGAQNPEHFHIPDQRFFERLNEAARGCIRYVNVAPEFGKSAVSFTRYLTSKGILVGAGHIACEADQVRRCAAAGMRIAVHFLNGVIGTSFKPFHGGNALEAVLQDPEMYVELICDGFHIAPAYVRDAIARKGLDHVVLITDAVFAAGAEGIRSFTLAGREGHLHPSGRYLQVKGSSELLFGSVQQMTGVISNALSWLTRDMEGIWQARHRALALDEALVALAKCAATIPAHLLGLDRPIGQGPVARNTGSLEPGRCADFVLASLTGGPGRWRLRAKQTFLEGRRIA